jgi:hypothetical protein
MLMRLPFTYQFFANTFLRPRPLRVFGTISSDTFWPAISPLAVPMKNPPAATRASAFARAASVIA